MRTIASAPASRRCFRVSSTRWLRCVDRLIPTIVKTSAVALAGTSTPSTVRPAICTRVAFPSRDEYPKSKLGRVSHMRSGVSGTYLLYDVADCADAVPGPGPGPDGISADPTAAAAAPPTMKPRRPTLSESPADPPSDGPHTSTSPVEETAAAEPTVLRDRCLSTARDENEFIHEAPGLRRGRANPGHLVQGKCRRS